MMQSLIAYSRNPTTLEYEYLVDTGTMVRTCEDPLIYECCSDEGTVLYIRWTGEELVCLEKRTGKYICSGTPFLFKGLSEIPKNQIEFHLEMYSNHKIKFY